MIVSKPVLPDLRLPTDDRTKKWNFGTQTRAKFPFPMSEQSRQPMHGRTLKHFCLHLITMSTFDAQIRNELDSQVDKVKNPRGGGVSFPEGEGCQFFPPGGYLPQPKFLSPAALISF